MGLNIYINDLFCSGILDGLSMKEEDYIDSKIDFEIKINTIFTQMIDKLEIQISLDPETNLITNIIGLISLAVCIIAELYMISEEDIIYFEIIILTFAIIMQFLTLIENLIIFMITWELIGVLSFLLIDFWDQKIEAYESGAKSLIINKIADISLLIDITSNFTHKDSFELGSILSLTIEILEELQLENDSFNEYTALLISLASMLKSGDLPGTGWLSDAMEGPTPVSSLLHSSTLVFAGYILDCKSIETDENISDLITLLVSVWNVIILSLLTLFQEDIKKIVAYSTSNQLSLSELYIGSPNDFLAYLHLIGHAFFKSLLFLTLGVIVHNLSNSQDIRNVGDFIFNTINFKFFYYNFHYNLSKHFHLHLD